MAEAKRIVDAARGQHADLEEEPGSVFSAKVRFEADPDSPSPSVSKQSPRSRPSLLSNESMNSSRASFAGFLDTMKKGSSFIVDLHDPDEEESQAEESWRHGATSPMATNNGLGSSNSLGLSQFAEPSERKKWLQKLVRSSQFDIAIGVVILINCVNIGVEQTARLNGDSTYPFYIAEQIFLGIYTTELILRFSAFGITCLNDNWVKFDIVLVASGIVANWILEPVMGHLDQIGPLMVLRTVRLCRLARTVRVLVKFRELWMLVRGLLNSANTMVYTMVLLIIIVYVFAAVGVELIADHAAADTNEEFRIVRDVYFRSLPVAMLTLIQFVCLDSVGAIYKPLIEEDIILLFYFSLIILVIPIVLMNLVTAVIVNGALEQASNDKDAARVHEEQIRKKLVNKMRMIFTRLDEDQSGFVSLDELMMVSKQDLSELEHCTNISDPRKIFEALDVEGLGQLGIEEFCNGIWQAAMSKVPMEVQRMERQVDSMFKRGKDREEREKSRDDREKALDDYSLSETVADLKMGQEKIHALLLELRADHVRLEQQILPERCRPVLVVVVVSAVVVVVVVFVVVVVVVIVVVDVIIVVASPPPLLRKTQSAGCMLLQPDYMQVYEYCIVVKELSFEALSQQQQTTTITTTTTTTQRAIR
ncbi:unnamed protein product [Polarella glacialis]|uniref:EF-hand domain-containing protein n=1 Tax=Polarella glacialis TaxID=89957 RepID=A0A813KTF7_POLGL|nr:unnamed protein product [Polarella glacialis]